MKALVLNSGGVDSTTCVGIAINKYGKDNVITASLYYGQKHDKELQCAQKVADYYGVRHIEEDISNVMKYAKDVCTLVKGGDNIEHASYAEQIAEHGEGRVATYVPFRNGLLLSIAAAYADSLFPGEKVEIFYGAHADDAAGRAYADAVAKGSKILMVDGSEKCIEDIEVGDIIWSFDETTQYLKQTKVLNVIYQGLRPVYLVDNLKVSENHIMWRAGTSKKNRFIPYSEMKRKNATYKVYKWPFNSYSPEDIKSYDLGYIRGFLDGDGHVGKYRYNEHLIINFYQKHKDVLEEIRTLLQKYYNMELSIHTKQENMYYMQNGSNSEAFLNESSFEKNSTNIDYLRGYLNGVIISEGCYHYNKADNSSALSVSQSLKANKEICDNIDYLLNFLNITSIKYINKDNIKCWRFNKAYRIPLLYGASKKLDILNKMCNRVKTSWLKQIQIPAIINNDCLGEEECYDLTTDSGTFIANRVLVHNCSPEFAESMDRAINIGTYGNISINRPLINMNKAEVVKTGLALNVPYELTWSCYEGREKQCGTCGTSMPGETLILMEDSSQKRLDEIQVGDKVKTFNEQTHKFEISEVTKTWVNGVKSLYGVYDKENNNLLFEATLDHKIIGRKFYNEKNHENFIYKELGWFKEYPFEVLTSKIPKINREEYVLGYLRGLVDSDGSIHDRGVYFGQKYDIETVREFKKLYNQYISPTNVTIETNKNGMTRFSGGYSKTFLEKTKEINSLSYYEGYINGFFIGDGYLTLYENPSNIHFGISQASHQPYLPLIERALKEIGIKYTKYVSVDTSEGLFKDSIEMVNYISNRAIDVFNRPWLFGGNKRVKTLNTLSQYSRDSRMLNHTMSYLDMSISREAQVYDITTTAGTFIANGVLVHNCIDRKAAFKANGVKDPVEYEE